MNTATLIIHSAKQIVTCASSGTTKRGPSMREVGIIPHGAIVVQGGQIAAVGTTDDLLRAYTAEQMIDASGKVVCPGLVDAHTHAVYAGDRVDEFEQRIAGASYMEIMAAGGGIASTMRATRAASLEQLCVEAEVRLGDMLHLGTTTVEIKTGYGLDTAAELKLLTAIQSLAERHEMDIVPTFLGAHAVPPEYAERTAAYVAQVVDEMMPMAAAWYQQSPFAQMGRPFYVDVFCEAGVFDLDQSRRVLAAGRALGLGVKIHADEFQSLGGVGLALELGATSVDHLDVTSADDIARLAASNTVGVVLPAVDFNLGSAHYANARALIDAGAAVALATDLNPGSAPCPSLPLVMAIACRYQKLLPAEVLNAATINAAHAVGMGGLVGSIEVGKQADLLILDVPDYRYLMVEFGGNPIETVIKRGQLV